MNMSQPATSRILQNIKLLRPMLVVTWMAAGGFAKDSYSPNQCLLGNALQPPTVGAPKTFLEDCPAWVIETTDAIWGNQHHVDEAVVDKYIYEDWVSHSESGTMRGRENLKKWMRERLVTFPDLHIHITDASCTGNDVDGYKTTMTFVNSQTFLGPDRELGAPTNRSAVYQGIAYCFVQKVGGQWQYIAEWNVRDAASMMLQLGLAPKPGPVPQLSMCSLNEPSWGWKSPRDLERDGHQLRSVDTLQLRTKNEDFGVLAAGLFAVAALLISFLAGVAVGSKREANRSQVTEALLGS